MSRRLPCSIALALALVCGSSRPARADPINTPSTSTSTPSTASWGWSVVMLSMVAGGAVTTASMTIQCPRDDYDCARWASLGVWGGIGLASTGAIVGLLAVKAHARQARVRVSLSVDRSSSGASMPRATLTCAF